MLHGFINRWTQSATSEQAEVSEATVKRHYKRFREEGILQNDPSECEQVILAPQQVKNDLPSRPRDYPAPQVKQEVIPPVTGSIQSISKSWTVSELCRRLEDTEALLEKAKASNDPTQGWLVVKHNETIVDILKELGRYFGLNKGTLDDTKTSVGKVEIEWLPKRPQ